MTLSMLLILFALFAGCKELVKEEADTPNQLASRGKLAGGMRLLFDASFSESTAGIMEAVRMFKESLTYDGSYSVANAYMAFAILELSRTINFSGEMVAGEVISVESALKYASRALEANPDSADGHSVLAMVCMRLHDYDGASSELSKVKRSMRENLCYLIAKADYLLGVSEKRPKNIAENLVKSAEFYVKATEVEPRCGIAYIRLMDLYELVEDGNGVKETLKVIKQMGMKTSPIRMIRYRQKGWAAGI